LAPLTRLKISGISMPGRAAGKLLLMLKSAGLKLGLQLMTMTRAGLLL